MTDISYREITNNGLWKNNAALVQLLGLCPLLAVTGSVVNALGLGLATMLVLTGSNIVVSLIRKRVSDAVKIPAFAILGRAEAFACKNKVGAAALDGFMMGAGFGIVLLVIGTIREILGSGTLFDNMHLIFGPVAENWTLHLFGEGYGFLVAVLPPGAFLVAGLLIALKNIIDDRIEHHRAAKRAPVIKGAKRVRTTGTVS